MRTASVIAMKDHQHRARRIGRAVAARRRLERTTERRGRIWVNGHELGGTDPRYQHLGAL
jgi:hypothetical protein